jgi:hypothetical protein
MNKTVSLELSEAEYRNLVLCFCLGDLVKDSIEQKSMDQIKAQMEFHQKLAKAAYQAKLNGAAMHGQMYHYSQEIEQQMLEIFEEFKEYVASGEDAEETKRMKEQLEKMGLLDKKKRK